MTLRNWFGQDIQVGDVVFRGARAGNNSDFKIGVVEKLVAKDGHGTRRVKVNWKYSQGYFWNKSPDVPNVEAPDRSAVRPNDYSGTVGVDTLVKISKDDLDRAGAIRGLVNEFYQTSMTAKELEAALDSLS